MSDSRRDEPLRPLRHFADTFVPYLVMIGAAMTWYANTPSNTQVDNKFQESLKYTDKAVEAIRVEATAKIETVKMEAHREAESNKTEMKAYSDANRAGARQELMTAIGEVKTSQAAMDSKLDFLVENAESPMPRKLKHR